MDEPTARVFSVDGQLVIDDPTAVALIQVIDMHNADVVRSRAISQKDRIKYFADRVKAMNYSVDEVFIVIINIDSYGGGPLADLLMPGQDWQQFRDRGELPIARGLCPAKNVIVEYAKNIRPNFTVPANKLVVIYFDCDSVYAFEAEDLLT